MTLPSVTAAILAGGANRRMGSDKALLELGDKPMAGHVVERARQLTDDVLFVAPEIRPYKQFGIPCEVDRHTGVGPLTGLETALLGLRKDCLLLLACDMPFIQPDVLRILLEAWDPRYQATAFRIDGVLHPMPALYRRDVLFAVDRLLARREYELPKLFSEIRVKEVGEDKLGRLDPELRTFINLNTIEAYRRHALEAQGKPPLSG